MRDLSERVEFRESDHTYWLNGRQLPSVTHLLHKHGIATDLSGAPEEVVRRAGEHGSLVHAEIEAFINTGEMGITDEFQDFLKLVYPMAQTWLSEVMVWTDSYAGRVDLIGLTDDAIIVVDTKTGAFNENYTSWQTSMYSLAFPNEAHKFVKLFAFDAKMDGKSRLIPLVPVSEKCVANLLEAESKGEIYNPMLPVVSANIKMLEVERQIVKMERQLAELEAQDVAFKTMLLKAMEEGRVTSYESDALKLTYVAPYTKTTLDSKAVQSRFPKVYEECRKTSAVKASVRLYIKEVNNAE